VDYICLEVYQRKAGKDVDICSQTTNCLSASSETLTCAIPGNLTNGQYFASAYIESQHPFSYIKFDEIGISIGDAAARWGRTGLLGTLLLVVALAGALAFNSTLAPIGAILGLIIAMLLGIIQLGWLPVVVLIVSSGILIARMRQ